MQGAAVKRTLLLFIVSLVMFSLCFTMHISATTSSESNETTSSEEVSSEVVTSPEVSDPESTPSSDESDQSSETDGTESTDSAVSDESNTESIESVVSDENSTDPGSIPMSSGEVSSLVVSTVSDGGAPDHTYESEWNAKQSYVYEGSYVGLSSDTASSEPEKQEIQTTNQSSTAQRYAKYAKIGMIVFGVLTAVCIGFLVYFNVKVKKHKQENPDLYPKKEKVKPKHGKH